ncbi:hypothetical protein SASPL_106083 [Salvia splendens]|uniref:Fatty acid omega-hydroxylase n=1 Tax=Salvia splendens TaxID=180675 RepID=A0A8X9A993_SALSN|nr:hypothetical protein SASPL_106083 [Salvia splendens]
MPSSSPTSYWNLQIPISLSISKSASSPTQNHQFHFLMVFLCVQGLFMRSTLDSIFKVVFGSDLDSTSGLNEEGARFSCAFDAASEITAWRYVDLLRRIKRALKLGLEARLKENVRVVDEFVYKLINTKIAHSEHHGKQDILSRFLSLSEADPKYLRDVVLNFVMTGKDTTATTLSWFFYMLCKHPLSQEKAAEEVKRVAAVTGSISELYPPVPVNPKMYLSDDTLPDGFHVRKGDVVASQPYAMGRMTAIWGDYAGEFRPERWLNDGGCFRPENPFKFTAFQAGPRICLGKEFAYRQMKKLSAVVLRFFALRLSDKTKAVNYRTMINLHIDVGSFASFLGRILSLLNQSWTMVSHTDPRIRENMECNNLSSIMIMSITE